MKNTKCNKKACYYKNNQYFCKTHAKQSEYIIPTSELNSTRLNKYKINELYQICEKFDIHYEKPISKKKLLETVNAQLSEKFLNTVEKKKADKINLVE